MTHPTIGFIGAGRMATALAEGLAQAGIATPARIVASDPSPVALGRFTERTGAKAAEDNKAVAQSADIVVLAVKPQQAADVFAELRGALTDRHLVISIMAGVSLAALEKGLGKGPRLARVMPNTPCLVGQGASGYCMGPTATAADGEQVGRMMSAVGIAFPVDEKLLDAVTGLSGSGPAFVYLMIEALSDGGVLAGLPRDVATALAAQTVRGAAEMVLSTGEHPGALKDQVASPGGTTIAGLERLEALGARGALITAVQAAAQRSAELARASSLKSEH